MTRRTTVVAMLRDGVSARGVSRELGVPVSHVHRIRAEHGIAPCRPGPRPYAATLAEAFWARTRPADGGHREWLGSDQLGCPVLKWEGRKHSVRQVAFFLRTGRRAIGPALQGCGVSWCVEPAHVDDAQERADLDALCLAVFGEVP